MSKAIGVVWFSGRSTIGVVMAYDEITEQPKAWIHRVTGANKEYDIKDIMKWGSKFPLAEACSLIMKHGDILDPELWDKVHYPTEIDSVQNKIGERPAKDNST